MEDIYNPSGYPCYVNVRNSTGNVRIGYASQVTGRGVRYVSYKSGYGNVGGLYRPAAQTDSDSTIAATLSGCWAP